MKNKKGFTLIELLAVIVVLAIIALITVPMILKIIEDARKGAAIASARSYIKAVETYVVSSELDKDKTTLISNNKYNVTATTTIYDKTYQAINNLIEIKGSLPIGSEDYIKTDENNQVTEALLTMNGYIILIKDDEVINISKGSIIGVESITLDKISESIKIGNTLQITATIAPDNATNKIVTWTSSNDSIATVDSKGLVVALKEGTITITAKSSNGKTATASINVYKDELLSDVVSVGDYVAYDAGEWTNSASKPTSQGNFGGYTAGQNKANSIACNNPTTLKGWRVLNVNKNTGTVTIVHAGQPECYYNMKGYTSVTALNNRAVNEYLNSDYATSAHNINEGEVEAITLPNNLRAIGAHYWLANSGDNNLYYINDGGYIGINWASDLLGVRPIVILKPNIKTTGKTTDAVGQEAWNLVAP